MKFCTYNSDYRLDCLALFDSSILTCGRFFILVNNPTLYTIRLGTSQYSYSFYEKVGLKVYQVTQNGIAPGFDEYLMQAEFNQEFRNLIERKWLSLGDPHVSPH